MNGGNGSTAVLPAIPAGWELVTLGDICLTPRPKIAPDPESTLPFVGMEHIAAHSLVLSGLDRFSNMKSTAVHFFPGDVLYGKMRPYLNKVHLAKFEGACSAEFIVFPEHTNLSSGFLQYLLHSRPFVNCIASKTSGDRPRADLSDILAYPLLLPPAREQERIVAKLDELFSEIEAGEKALERARLLVQRYRQSVLKAAVTGELTREWREKNLARLKAEKKTGADLLADILKKRREAWEAAELAKMRAKGKEPRDDKWKSRYQEPAAPDTSKLPELPEGWAWATMEQLISDGPTNGYSPKSSSSSQGSLSLKLTATTSGEFRLDAEAIKTLDEVIAPDSRYWLSPGDLLIQRGNTIEYVGTAAIFPGPANTYIYPDLMMRVRTETPDVRFWLWRYINGPAARRYFQKRATGTAGTMPKINSDILCNMLVPVPCNEEIGLLNERLAEISEQERFMLGAIDQEQRRSSTLRQSILAAAFSGKLVPQDPADEPASELLARIRAERDQPQRGASNGGRSLARARKQPAQSRDSHPTLFD